MTLQYIFITVFPQYSTMLVRPVATDKRAFYLLNTTDSGPQVSKSFITDRQTDRKKGILPFKHHRQRSTGQ